MQFIYKIGIIVCQWKVKRSTEYNQVDENVDTM